MPKSRSELNNTQITPKPSLEKRTRRKFFADYKLRIIAEADACRHGELGALLRREHLYSNQLSNCAVSMLSKVLRGWLRVHPAPHLRRHPISVGSNSWKKTVG